MNIRKIRKFFKIRYSYDSVNRAFAKVRQELFDFQILTPSIEAVDCIWQELTFGLTINPERNPNKSDKLLDRIKSDIKDFGVFGFTTYKNKIYIPEYAWGRGMTTIVDVIRHEFAHAYANLYQYDSVFKGFALAFGGNYGEINPDCVKRKHCVSFYAEQSTQEDFAETFMFYLKFKGKIPSSFAEDKYIAKKWDFVRIFIKSLAKKEGNVSVYKR